MRWKQMLFTIVLNIFLMLLMSVMLEYSDLTERFVAIEDTVQEALDLAISASVHSEEFFSADYQGKLMSYAGVGDTDDDDTTEATTLIWLKDSQEFTQLNTYQFAHWYNDGHFALPRNTTETADIASWGTGLSYKYGLSGAVFEWLYGGAGTDYLASGLYYANRNAARREEYNNEDTGREITNTDFKDYYDQVGRLQETVGYLKEWRTDDSYTLALTTYPVLCNMGLEWMDSRFTADTSHLTADNFSSSLHIGKSRYNSISTYYFLTPSSLGVTYVPVEVLKPVFVANLDTIVRLNKLGAASVDVASAGAAGILNSASDCVETSVYDFNDAQDAYENADYANLLGAGNHAEHLFDPSSEEIVTDGLVEFDLSTAQVKVDYFFWDFADGSPESALLISKLNGTLTADVAGAGGEASLRDATLQAFLDQDTSKYVSPFTTSTYYDEYEAVSGGRVIARVTAKIKVHVPYKSSILQWASYMFTGTRHFDIKRYDPSSGMTIGDDGIWYQYTTYFCTSRS